MNRRSETIDTRKAEMKAVEGYISHQKAEHHLQISAAR